jgi:hypothetical protein
VDGATARQPTGALQAAARVLRRDERERLEEQRRFGHLVRAFVHRWDGLYHGRYCPASGGSVSPLSSP